MCLAIFVIRLLRSAVSKDEAGDVVAINQFNTFIIGAGGFGGKTKSERAKVSQSK